MERGGRPGVGAGRSQLGRAPDLRKRCPTVEYRRCLTFGGTYSYSQYRR